MKQNAVSFAGLVLLLLPGVCLAESFLSPRDLWPQATAAIDVGDTKGATQKVDQLLEHGRIVGVTRYPLYAMSAASLARQENGKNNSVSRWALQTAERLDRVSPNVAFTKADIARDQKNWGMALGSLTAGVARLFGEYRSRFLARCDFLTVLLAALSTLAAAFSLVLFLRYRRSAAHDFREMFVAKFGGGVVSVLAYALLFLPIFLWLGPLWLVLYWLCLFFAYASTAERVLCLISLLILALMPLALGWNSYRIAGVDSPVVSAALATGERSYDPSAIRRIRDLQNVVSNEPSLNLLTGNLALQEGDEQEASIQYKRAIELNGKFAGAYLNLGNLYFYNNDFTAAITNYSKAELLSPTLAIAYYNHSVANGETYKFEEQGKNLETAKKYDRALMDALHANPPAQKVVMYQLPISEAWRISEQIANNPSAREVFGNFSTFHAGRELANPLTLGALLAIPIAVLLGFIRKRANIASECIKCGRTFCYRCKSSRESATYCTQCIHIYLKRDGVSIDTKRLKIEEVQQFQSEATMLRRLVTTLLPGTAQMMDGRTLRGLTALALFTLFVWLAILVGRLGPVLNPAETARAVLRGLAIAAAVAVWFTAVIPVFRQRQTG